jgi:glyoxylase-like metal-dependent hydrolase (beta-lactamase superfamily II)
MSHVNMPATKTEPIPGIANRYETDGGGQIFRIPVNVFPRLWGYVYVALVENYRVLIDTGSGYGDSNQHLEAGLKAACDLAGVDLTLPNLTHILITHGHIDHYGGLSYVRPLTPARLGIHELDRGVVTHQAERLFMVARRLDEFLAEAGVSSEKRGPILDMYKMTKGSYQPVPVDFTFEAQGMRLGPFEMLHVPGHCPGHVVIRLHDVLFSGDHVLDEISPHQAPEHLMPSTGLEHYLKSLEALRPWSKEVRLTLGGHENPMTDLEGRLDAIRELHRQRLQKVLDFLADPLTIAEVSHKLFGEVNGYNVLLALEEAGAHVEYLYQRGLLSIENLPDLERGRGLMPIRYRCVECKLIKL